MYWKEDNRFILDIVAKNYEIRLSLDTIIS